MAWAVPGAARADATVAKARAAEAKVMKAGTLLHLGTFDTAVKAAVAVARYFYAGGITADGEQVQLNCYESSIPEPAPPKAFVIFEVDEEDPSLTPTPPELPEAAACRPAAVVRRVNLSRRAPSRLLLPLPPLLMLLLLLRAAASLVSPPSVASGTVGFCT